MMITRWSLHHIMKLPTIIGHMKVLNLILNRPNVKLYGMHCTNDDQMMCMNKFFFFEIFYYIRSLYGIYIHTSEVCMNIIIY